MATTKKKAQTRVAAPKEGSTDASKRSNAGTRGERRRTSKKRTRQAPEAQPAPKKPTRAATGGDTPDLNALRAAVTDAEAAVARARTEAEALEAQARTIVAAAKDAYRAALAPYRDACRNAGVRCEFTGGRATNVSERVSFDVVKVSKGLKVTVKGRPETEEVIPMEKLKVSIGKSAEQYCEKHIGPRDVVGNKQGSLQNRLRAVLKG